MRTVKVSYTTEDGSVLTAIVRSRTRWVPVQYAHYISVLAKVYPEAIGVDVGGVVNISKTVQNGEVSPALLAFVSQQSEPLARYNNIDLFANLAARLLMVGEGLPFDMTAGIIPDGQIAAAYTHYGNEDENDGLWSEITKAIISMDSPAAPIEEAVGTVDERPLSENGSANGDLQPSADSAKP